MLFQPHPRPAPIRQEERITATIAEAKTQLRAARSRLSRARRSLAARAATPQRSMFEAPATEAPTTEAPTTEAPTTEAPTFEGMDADTTPEALRKAMERPELKRYADAVRAWQQTVIRLQAQAPAAKKAARTAQRSLL